MTSWRRRLSQCIVLCCRAVVGRWRVNATLTSNSAFAGVVVWWKTFDLAPNSTVTLTPLSVEFIVDGYLTFELSQPGDNNTFAYNMSVYTSYTAMPGEPSVELAVSSEKVVSTLFNPTIVQTSGRYNGGATDPQFSAAMDCGDGGVIAFTIVSGQVDVLLANTTVRTVRYVASPVVLSVVCEAGSVLAFYNVGAEDCVYAWAPAATPAPPTPAPPPATPAPIPLPPPPVPSPPHEGVVVQTEVVLGVLNTSLYEYVGGVGESAS